MELRRVLALLTYAYRLENTRAAFCVPAFDTAVEFLASIVNAVIVVLIVYGPGKTVTEHALCKRR